MKSNPKTIAGVIVLVILAVALGFLLSKLFPTIGEVQREMSLTPTPLPDVPGSVMAVTTDPSAPTPEPVLRTGSRGDDVKMLQGRLHDLRYCGSIRKIGRFQTLPVDNRSSRTG